MRWLLVLFCLGVLSPWVPLTHGQISVGGGSADIRRGTVAAAPTCNAAAKGVLYIVTDGADTTDCTVGNGTAVNDCYCDGTNYADVDNASGGGAPTDVTYITQTASGSLSAEQATGTLASALLVNTTTTGVLSAYAGAACTNQVVTALSALGAATCTTITTDYLDFDPVDETEWTARLLADVTFGDDIVVTDNVAAASVTVTGAADAIEMAVRRSAAQTANIQEWQTELNAPLASVGADGTITGTLFVGPLQFPATATTTPIITEDTLLMANVDGDTSVIVMEDLATALGVSAAVIGTTFPVAPADQDFFIITTASGPGLCDAGTSPGYAQACKYDLATTTWLPQPFTDLTAPTLETVITAGRSATSLTNFANAVRFGDTANQWRLWCDGAGMCSVALCPDAAVAESECFTTHFRARNVDLAFRNDDGDSCWEINKDTGALESLNPGGTCPNKIAITGQLEIPNGAAPTTDAAGEIGFDTNAWTRGALQIFDGTANTYAVAALASDAPTNGQTPVWNTGGTVTWETPAAATDTDTVLMSFGGSDATGGDTTLYLGANDYAMLTSTQVRANHYAPFAGTIHGLICDLTTNPVGSATYTVLYGAASTVSNCTVTFTNTTTLQSDHACTSAVAQNDKVLVRKVGSAGSTAVGHTTCEVILKKS